MLTLTHPSPTHEVTIEAVSDPDLPLYRFRATLFHTMPWGSRVPEFSSLGGTATAALFALRMLIAQTRPAGTMSARIDMVDAEIARCFAAHESAHAQTATEQA